MTPSDTPELEVLRERSAFHPSAVFRRGDMLIKEAGAATNTIHALLRHLEQVGFDAAPKVWGTGFDEQGRETLSFIEGAFLTCPWSLAASYEVGVLLRQLQRGYLELCTPGRSNLEAVVRPATGYSLELRTL